MDRQFVLSKLQEHAPELRAAGLAHVRVFGSTARGEGNDRSDIDLLVDFDGARQQTLVTVSSLRTRLSEMLQAEVDLTSPTWLREPARSSILREAILAF